MPRAPKEPPRIPGYEILEPLGSGGQGSVWRARQKSLDRVVAIKTLWADDASDPVIARRFIEEARIASKLSHPNIIQVIDVGEAASKTYWYAMEFVAGVTALDLFRERGPLPEGEVLEIAWQVAQALQHGNDRGLVHGDLKPENIIITPEGVVKVVDFGLARLSHRRGWRKSADDEFVQGTEGFVAPEILANKSTGDARTDLFALGVTIYELLTTTLPPSPGRDSALGPDVRQRRPNVTRRTAELVMRLLAPDPERRLESPAKLLEELGRRSSITLPAAVSPVAPVKPPQSSRLRRTGEASVKGRRRILVAAIFGAAVLAGLGFALKAIWVARPHVPPAPRESRPADGGQAQPELPGSRETPPPGPVQPESRTGSTPSAAGATPPKDHRVGPPVMPPPPVANESREAAREGTEPPGETRHPPPTPGRDSRTADPAPGVDDRPAPRATAAPPPAPPEVPSLSSASASIRIDPPAPSAAGAPWTVVAPAGDPCDFTLRPPGGFDSTDTAAEIVPEGRAKGLSLKSGDEPGSQIATYRGDRAAPWGPRDFTVVFRRGGASSRLRVRIQVSRPNLLTLAPTPPLKAALDWLERHQGSGGAISADGFWARCAGGKKCDGAGQASGTTGVTALAVIAALHAGENGDWVRRALAAITSSQRSDGRFATDEGAHGAYAHMMGTEATALGWHLLGDAAARDAAQRGVQAIEAARNPQAAGGAWRYGVQSGENDTSVTIWALRALLTAKMAGLKTSDAAIESGTAWIRRVTETNPNDSAKGRIGYRAPGELPVRSPGRELLFPPALSEALTAGGLSVALAAGDRKPAEDAARSGLNLVLLCRPHWDCATPEAAAYVRKRLNNPGADLSVISPRDYYYWQLATALFRTWKLVKGPTIPDDKRWNLARVLAPAQRKDGCAAGSFDPGDPWGPELGRAGSTAILALALANEQYAQALLDEFPQ